MITLEESKKMVGQIVIYDNGFCKDYGVVSSCNDVFIFVKFFSNNELMKTSQATKPENLFKFSNEINAEEIKSLSQLNRLLDKGR